MRREAQDEDEDSPPAGSRLNMRSPTASGRARQVAEQGLSRAWSQGLSQADDPTALPSCESEGASHSTTGPEELVQERSSARPSGGHASRRTDALSREPTAHSARIMGQFGLVSDGANGWSERREEQLSLPPLIAVRSGGGEKGWHPHQEQVLAAVLLVQVHP